MPLNLGPHDFQANPGDLVALRRSRVLVVDASCGVPLLQSAPVPSGGHHGGHDHGAVNPHVWLDPQRAAQQVATIRDGLIQADPGCAEGYRQRAAATTAQLRQLDSAIARQLQPYRGKTFVAFHDVAPYFAERYGLKAEFLVDVPELNPTPADLQRVAAQVKRSDLQALLSEPQEGQRPFNAWPRIWGCGSACSTPWKPAAPKRPKTPRPTSG